MYSDELIPNLEIYPFTDLFDLSHSVQPDALCFFKKIKWIFPHWTCSLILGLNMNLRYGLIVNNCTMTVQWRIISVQKNENELPHFPLLQNVYESLWVWLYPTGSTSIYLFRSLDSKFPKFQNCNHLVPAYFISIWPLLIWYVLSFCIGYRFETEYVPFDRRTLFVSFHPLVTA